MSTTADVVHDVANLVKELKALLETKTAQAVPQIAADLGAQDQLHQGIDALKALLDKIIEWVNVLRHTVVDADALVALVGFLPGLVAAVGDVVNESGDMLGELGLDLGDVAATTGTISGHIGKVSDVLEVGADAAEAAVQLAAPEELPGLAKSLTGFRTTLLELKKPPTTDSSQDATKTAVPGLT